MWMANVLSGTAVVAAEVVVAKAVLPSQTTVLAEVAVGEVGGLEQSS